MSGGGGATGHLMQLSGAIIYKGVIECILSVLKDTHLAHHHIEMGSMTFSTPNELP